MHEVVIESLGHAMWILHVIPRGRTVFSGTIPRAFLPFEGLISDNIPALVKVANVLFMHSLGAWCSQWPARLRGSPGHANYDEELAG